MTVLLSPVGGVAAQFFDNNGNPLSGGKLFSYAAGTTTPAATYTSSLGNTAHTNPIVLDAGGRVPGGEIWLTDGVIYKFVLQTSTDVLIATYDNIVGINSNFVNYTTEQEIQTATAGQTVFNLTTMQYQPGTNSLTVYVDGVNQYGPGAQYAYVETDSDTVTFMSGLHVGASVKFTTATQTTGNATDASVVAYTPPFTGSVTTNVEAKLAQTVSVMDFGAVGDGVADDTAAIQAAIDYVTTVGGGNVYFPVGTYLAGGVVVNNSYINISGASEASVIKVKNGTVGVQIKKQWCNVRDIRFVSQGTKSDGLNTRGLLYEQASQNSVGLANCQNVTFDGFSGYGMQITEAINFYLNRAYVKNCTIGINIVRVGTGPADFSTTIDFENIYVTDCGTGIYGEYVYRSRFNVIAERCTYGMDFFVGDVTLFRCYFEANTTLGGRFDNCRVQNLWSYNNNPVTDAVSITYSGGAIAASERGYLLADSDDLTAKRLGLLSGYGVDPLWLAAYGTTSNDGLKYGENTVALVRGTNLFDNAAWSGNNAALNDFDGWSNLNQGYKIAGTVGAGGTNDPYGMKQTVTLNNTKTYVIDLNVTNVAGSGITAIKVGSDDITNGVAFTPTANGSQAVKCFGADVTGTVYEAYVNAFTLAEVLADQTQVAEANDRLTREKNGRGVSYAAAAPTTGTWLQGEVVYNTAPAAGGFVGWVCTTSGTPGTWKTFGAISA